MKYKRLLSDSLKSANSTRTGYRYNKIPMFMNTDCLHHTEIDWNDDYVYIMSVSDYYNNDQMDSKNYTIMSWLRFRAICIYAAFRYKTSIIFWIVLIAQTLVCCYTVFFGSIIYCIMIIAHHSYNYNG